MADLADKIDDLICSFEGGGDSTMDTVAMLVFGWTVLALFGLAIAKYVYARFIRKVPVPVTSETKPATETGAAVKTPETDVKPETKAVAPVAAAAKPTVLAARSGGKYVPPTPPLRKRLTAKKGPSPSPNSRQTPPTASGPDAEAVRWTNALLSWIYTDPDALNELVTIWIHNLNEIAKKSVEEVSFLAAQTLGSIRRYIFWDVSRNQ